MHIRQIKLKKMAIYILITLGFGIIGAILGGNTGKIYADLNKPLLSPPSLLFPIVWSLLYVFMGIAAYLISEQKNTEKSTTLIIYWAQLALNAIWPFVFWRLQNFVLAAIIIFIIILFTIVLITRNINADFAVSVLFMPYLIWLLFAFYLNIGIAILN